MFLSSIFSLGIEAVRIKSKTLLYSRIERGKEGEGGGGGRERERERERETETGRVYLAHIHKTYFYIKSRIHNGGES